MAASLTASKEISAGPATTVDDAIEQIGVGRFQWRLLFVNGLTWAADAMEVLIIGFVLPAITALWGLTTGQAGLVAAATFAGMFVGASGWGLIADRVGRRKVFLLTVLLDALFGLLSALSPNLTFLIIFRFLTGTAVGGTLPVDYAIMAEYLPTKQRGRFLVFLESFWALGTIIVAFCAWLLIPQLPETGWRYLLAISALPGILGYWVRRTVPESPRFLLIQGRADEAREVLHHVAAMNGKTIKIGQLEAPRSSGKTTASTIWRSPLTRRTLLLSVIWFSLSLGYYGIFTWLPSIFVKQGFSFVRSYGYLVLLALAQIPGYTLAAYLVERIGRKVTLALFLISSALFSYLFAVATTAQLIVGAAMLLSFSLLGAWGALYAYTPELFPTEVRTTGMGWVSAMARAAGVLSPPLGIALLAVSLPLALSVYAAFFVVGAIAALLINIETRNRRLTDVTLGKHRSEARS
jgi:putative MFS transporter